MNQAELPADAGRLDAAGLTQHDLGRARDRVPFFGAEELGRHRPVLFGQEQATASDTSGAARERASRCRQADRNKISTHLGHPGDQDRRAQDPQLTSF
ncbi:hypothetical protein FH609_019065 [Streptomyces sp. 3MP-14]|uniref:Uncharacterized protein n=1 Tax=Streptomyces mimosae TaxID=2586635 RepID=A0A5N6A6Z8_9ACTN|nr:hypothetical protein FH607_017605 [Streptomyces mimosae]KAB8175206.1 hypothetical protein FH609_019065 [Streptomyces sp. 3MP-14]